MFISTSATWSNSTSPTTSAAHQAVMNNNVLLVLEYLSPALSIILGSLGLVFNFINTKVFLKQGVKDCVSVCLLSLSFSDNGSLLFGLMAAACFFFYALTDMAGLKYFIDPMSVWRLFVQGQFCFYDLSTYTTAFIAIERCLCVVLPFNFKSIFNLRTSQFVLLCLYTGTFLLHMFFFAFTEFRTIYNPKFNISQSIIYFGPTRLLLEKYLQVFNHLCLSCVAMLTILVTSGLMIHRLQRANKFRRQNGLKTITKTLTRNLQVIHPEISVLSENVSCNNIVKDKNVTVTLDNDIYPPERCKRKLEENGLNARHLRLVKMVYTLAVICFLSDAFRFLAMTTFYGDRELRPGGVRASTGNILGNFVYLVQIVNCSVNILVYLTCNQSYRLVFLSLFKS
uniref:G-protein coupled receptors family 1 profile domain-containing protein n=1 Tax=Biomphalaria glabrata TaxID=6526 RepID=A0A2C9L9U7_BIOGL